MSTPALELNTHCCTVCGIHKREANHWRILGCATFEDGLRKLTLHDWDESVLREAKELMPHIDVAIACGEAHTLALVSRFLETGSFDVPAVRSEPAQKASYA